MSVRALKLSSTSLHPKETLQDLIDRLTRKELLLPINAELKLTKTKKRLCTVTIMRDHDLEEMTYLWIERRCGSFSNIDGGLEKTLCRRPLNDDNDSWIGLYIWNKFKDLGILT